MIYSTSLPYTVPSPQGKAAGVGYDGRLHALYAELVGVAGGELGGMILTYALPTGGTFEWRMGNNAAGSVPEGQSVYAQLAAEPQASGFSGETFGEPLVIQWMGAGGFRWMPAGTVIDLILDPDQNVGSVQVHACLVEDFGQLAEGDEYSTRVPRDELGGYLLTSS